MKKEDKKLENKFIAYKIKQENLEKMKEYLTKQTKKDEL
jgi:hypothetical protein